MKDKTRLIPENKNADKKEKSDVEKYRDMKKGKSRIETQKFKKQYFDLYDDIKINHREDW
jgi:hypothetical protein